MMRGCFSQNSKILIGKAPETIVLRFELVNSTKVDLVGFSRAYLLW